MAGTGRLENLGPPWTPGQSGNPSGRPKKRPISDRYSSYAEMRLPKELRLKLGLWKGATYGDAITKSVFDAALEGKCQATREIREGIEGRSNQRHETKDKGLITYQLVYEPPVTRRNEIPNDVLSVPNASQDDEKGSK